RDLRWRTLVRGTRINRERTRIAYRGALLRQPDVRNRPRRSAGADATAGALTPATWSDVGRGGGGVGLPVGGRLAHLQGAQLGQHAGVLGVEPLVHLPEGDQPHVGVGGDGAQRLLDGGHVYPAVPALEVVADEQWRPVGG